MLGLLVGASFLICGIIVAHSAAHARNYLRPPRKPVAAPKPSEKGAGFQDVSFLTSDQLTIRGWYLPPRNHATIVLMHGLGENRTQMLFDADILSRHGYGVLLFDWRAHGESDGSLVTWGDREQRDLRSALDFLTQRPEVDPKLIGAVGFSIGGSVVVQVAATDPRLAAIVLEGTYTSLHDIIRDDFGRWGLLSQLPARWTFRQEGIDVSGINNVKAISAVHPRPILLINGDGYDVPAKVEAELYEAAREPKDYWLVPGADHGEYTKVAPVEYERRLLAFFDGAFQHKSPHKPH